MFICSAWLLLGVSKPSTPPGRALFNPQLPLSAHGDLSSISPVGITYARCGSPGNEPKTEKKKHIQEKHVSWFEKQWEQIHSRVWAWLWESGREHVCSLRAVVLDFPSFVIFVFLKKNSCHFFPALSRLGWLSSLVFLCPECDSFCLTWQFNWKKLSFFWVKQ